MRGSEIAARIAELPSAKARSAAMAGAAAAGLSPGVGFCAVKFVTPSAELDAFVMSDALRLGDRSDWFYATLTAEQSEALASSWGLVIPSPQMVDKVWESGSKAPPVILPAGPKMASIAYALSATAKRQARHAEPAAGCEETFWGQSGKWWVIVPRLWTDKTLRERSANYGFFTQPQAPPAPPGTAGPKPSATRKFTLWQQPGTRHSYANFTDYSQTFRAFYEWGWLTEPGKEARLVNLKDVALGEHHKLLNPAPIKLWHPKAGKGVSQPGRAPGVPVYDWS
jgi:hypothetical protein